MLPGRRSAGPLLLALAWLGSGCATYTDKIESATQKVSTGQYEAAMSSFNELLDVDSDEELPGKWKDERRLAVLERAVLKQALEDYAGSERDLSAGDAELELLDYKSDAAGSIGEWIYSDSAADYRAPPTERLALNSVNMLNYLARGDWDGAAVEARRFQTMREYLESVDLGRLGVFGAYLAGLTFERLGQGDRALRYYEEAMAERTLPSLQEAVSRLAASYPYRGPRIRELLGDGAAGSSGPVPPPAEIVTVVSLGRVPKKVPERMPVGVAIGLAGTFITGNPQVLARSAFKVVVYPELVDSGSLARDAAVEVGGAQSPVDRVASTGSEIKQEYERLKPRIIGAALTRMIARAVAAEGARIAGQQAGGNAGFIVGLLAALGTEAALVSLDRPDTRSWTLLPDQVLISRQVVQPGTHAVTVRVAGPGLAVLREFDVEVAPGQAVVVAVTEPR